VLCTTVVHNDTQTRDQFLKLSVGLGLALAFCVCFALTSCMFFCFSLDNFVLALFAFVVLGLVSSVLSHEIAWEERLGNDPFCVEWDVMP